jgi:hypothetical protein
LLISAFRIGLTSIDIRMPDAFVEVAVVAAMTLNARLAPLSV